MMTYKLNGKEYRFAENWDDVTLRQYIKIAKIQEESLDYAFRELYLLKLIECLSGVDEGELDDLPLDMVAELGEKSLFTIKMDAEMKKNTEVKIGDVLYTPPKDFTKLSIGEFISLKTYQEANKNIWDSAAWMLAILWRPTEIVIDSESGEERRVREKFKVENLEWRKNLFLDQSATSIFGPLLFFSTMSSGYIPNTKDYTPVSQGMVGENDPARLELTGDIHGSPLLTD